MTLPSLQDPQSIIQLDEARRFWEAVETYTDRKLDRNILRDLRASIESIRHKLNVIRYNAGLIQTLSEDDYAEFITPLFQLPFSMAHYQDRCIFEMRNQLEFRLFMTLFLENLSAAAFSLQDVCAHLIKDLFAMSFPDPSGITYKNVTKQIDSLGYTTLHNVLMRYRVTTRSGTAAADQVDWIDPLEQIRHRMTHRPITDILRINSDGNLFIASGDPFLVHERFFVSGNAENLKTFAERCYLGLAEFVAELYEQLIIEVNNARTVPV